MTPRPPRPGGVEMATMVSERGKRHWAGRRPARLAMRAAGARAIPARTIPPRTIATRAIPAGTIPAGTIPSRTTAASTIRLGGARRFGQTGHAGGVYDNLAGGTRADALAAHCRLIAQSQMDDAALAAVHGIEPERNARA